jgi:cyclopropane fatty-acyl-phospholipid synthase-like methyltransferase
MICPICGSNSVYKFDRKFINQKIYQCDNIKCKHLFVEDLYETSGVCNLESSLEELKKDKQKRIDTFDTRNRLVFKNIFNKLGLKDNARVLDFGSADGNVMHSLRSVFPEVHITCIEANKNYTELLCQVADEVVDSVTDLCCNYDLIVLNEVIEHLPSPICHLQSLSKLLKKENAGIFIATPLGETHLNLNNTTAFDVPTHLHFFTRKSLNNALIKSGFTSLDTDDSNYPLYSAFYGRTLKNKIRNKIVRLIRDRILKISSRNCVLPADHVSGLAYIQ